MPGEKRIFTMGTSDRKLEEMTRLLQSHQINLVVDLRSFPKSKFPQFNQDALTAFLKEVGLGYHYMGKELGGFRKEGYEAYTRTDSYRQGLDLIEQLATRKRSVLLCAERIPWRCHRRFIAQDLQKRNWQVVHL